MRTIIVCVLGTVFAVFYPFIPLPPVPLAFIKILAGVVLALLLYFKTYRPVISSALFMLFSFLIGGACFAIGFVIYGDTIRAEMFCNDFPTYAALLVGLAAYFIVRLVFSLVRKRLFASPFNLDCELTLFGERLKFSGFYDSGNLSFDNLTGLPIIVCGMKTMVKKLPSAYSAKFMYAVTEARKITIKTPAGKSSVYLMQPDKFELYLPSSGHKIVDVMLGVVGSDTDGRLILNSTCV